MFVPEVIVKWQSADLTWSAGSFPPRVPFGIDLDEVCDEGREIVHDRTSFECVTVGHPTPDAIQPFWDRSAPGFSEQTVPYCPANADRCAAFDAMAIRLLIQSRA